MRGVLLLVAALATTPAAAQPPEELFVHRSDATTRTQAAQAAPGRFDAITSRARIEIRIDALFDRPTGVAAQIVLNAGLHSWTALHERVDVDAAGFRSWVGRLDGIQDSHVVFTERAGVVSGLINAVGVTYQVRSDGPGTHLLESVDTDRLPHDADPVVSTANVALDDPGVAVSDDASTIDVLILYTPAARAQRGSTAAVEGLASQVISDTNTAFARSGIVPRVRLVGTREFARLEAPNMSSDLAALRSSPEARALRDAARADLVQLLVSSPDQSACGVGYLLTSLSDTNFDAYSVADVACAAQYTPTHELGHNMGSNHAPEDAASGALFPYSYGYKDPARGFRTVMAYSCTGVPCPRVPNFSNPAVFLNGATTGTSSQNNARSINEAAFTIANFRQSMPSPGTITPPGTPTGLRSEIVGSNVTIAWDPVLAETVSQPSAASAYILQAGTDPTVANLYNGSVGAVTSVSGTLLPGTYFWRVIAINSAGQSAPSPIMQFVIGACAPPSPPSNFTFAIEGRNVTLAWNAATGPGLVTYAVEAGSAPTLTNLLVAGVGAQTAVATSAPPGTYYVRVRAQNACGTSAASNEQIIVVP